jgi:hypothetical protein
MPRRKLPQKKVQQVNVASFPPSVEFSRDSKQATHSLDPREMPIGCAQGELLWLKFKLERRNRSLTANPWSAW